MQRRKQGVAEVVHAHPRRDPHVPRRELGAERMMGLVEASACEVVAYLRGDRQAEVELRRLGEPTMQTAVVRWRLIADLSEIAV
jgi:hypothetical protein